MFFGFDMLDKRAIVFLHNHGIDTKSVIAAAKSDLGSGCEYATTWALLLPDKLVIASESTEVFLSYFFEEIEEVYAETLLATGQLIVKLKGAEYPVCSYTNTVSRTFGRFANIAMKKKRGEEITAQDFEKFEDENICPTCGKPYKDRARKICPRCMNRKALFLRVLSYMPVYKWEIIAMFALILAVTGISLVRPYVSGVSLYDDVLAEGGRYYGQILALVGVLVGMEVISLAIRILQGRIGASVSAKIICDIKVQVFGSMQRLSMSFFNSKRTGNLMNRVNSDALEIQYFLNDGMPYFIINAITLIGIMVIMIKQSLLLALIVFLPIPLIVYMIKRVVPKFHKLKWLGWIKSSRLNSVINDSLSGIRVVKAFGREKSEVERFQEASEDLYKNRVREGYTGAVTFPVLSYIMGLGGLFVWGFGGASVMQGDMTFGMLMTFIGYIGMIYGPIDFMIHTFDWWENCMNSAQRIFEIMDTRSDVEQARNPVAMPHITGNISMRNVTFEYEPNKPVLHNISLDIKAGEMIGLVGHSGAGKSTITNIITRLYDVNEGAIYIDGVNIKDISLHDLHSQIGMVLQDTFLFSGSIMENIAYARPNATKEEVIDAAKKANAHDFIMRLPDGYETELGRRKTNLSGGERQRISIARAILLDPRILILDEATASVDTETEEQIQKALETLTSSRTTIAIAHRLSTLRNADKIVVVEHGEIAEVGTHAELEKSGGKYAAMLGMQREALRIRGFDDEE
ncbi:MAG: ABC transporter ATP-binding protein [Clostridia bacterium]|nr:ABC transporter ATP-binding protein [Clostridia bacterium]